MENRVTQSFKYSKGSAANVISGFRQFLYFTAFFNLSPIPASETTITLFLEFMARTVGYDHLKHLLTSVKFVHASLNVKFPADSFQVDITMQGLKRRLAKVPFRVLPVTPAILRSIYKYLDMSNVADLALWCSFLTAFYGLLRKASTVPGQMSEEKKTCLLRRNVHIDSENRIVYLYLGYSKTNNFCTRDIVIPIPGNTDPALDLVRHLEELFSRVPVTRDKPAFSYCSRSCITYDMFTKRLKQLLKKAGLDPDLFSGHSFRRGGATFLHNCGGTVFMVQASGDWSSQCFARYLYLSEDQRLAAQMLIKNGIEGNQGPQVA